MTEETVSQFKEKYESLAGVVHVVGGIAEAAETVLSILREAEAKCVALGELPGGVAEAVAERCNAEGIELVGPQYRSADLPGAIDAAQAGVGGAAFGIAETGTIVEFATNDATRLVSALPLVHVAVLRAGDLVETLMEAAAPIRDFYERNPKEGGVTFISGPSRTADIEMKLTLGVHGPAASHVVVLKE
jgi:L-lactate dehydrogenase complex protein LldG